MGLNVSKGNMYEWITHTWNPLAGECPHGCSYCSTNKLMRYPGIKNKYTGPPRIHELEMKTNLGKGNFIFVVAQNDLFAEYVSDEIIGKILEHCKNFDNHYLLQTKNPEGFHRFFLPNNFSICTTIESNRFYKEFMGNSPEPYDRSVAMFNTTFMKKYVTIEPIMNFDLDDMLHLIGNCSPIQVNIGADSGNNNLPEPSKGKILELITELEKFTKVKLKKNLNRLIKR